MNFSFGAILYMELKLFRGTLCLSGEGGSLRVQKTQTFIQRINNSLLCRVQDTWRNVYILIGRVHLNKSYTAGTKLEINHFQIHFSAILWS